MVSKLSLLRGIDVRGVRSSQIMLHMMDGIKPAPATAIAMILTTGKTINSLAHDENTVGFLRNKDRNICAVGALASYMVYKEDLAVREDSYRFFLLLAVAIQYIVLTT